METPGPYEAATEIHRLCQPRRGPHDAHAIMRAARAYGEAQVGCTERDDPGRVLSAALGYVSGVLSSVLEERDRYMRQANLLGGLLAGDDE